jgi:hypothetical protein
MGEASKFIIDLYDQFSKLEKRLRNVLREEKILEKNILVKSGILIRRYSIKINTLNLERLREIKEELTKVKFIEATISHKIKEAEEHLYKTENDYNAYKEKKIKLKKILKEYMNNAFMNSRIASERIFQLEKLSKSGENIKTSRSDKVKRLILSLEKVTNQIILFIDILKQLSESIKTFEKNNYYPNPRTYGRAMSPKEEKKTLSKEKLSGSQKRQENELIGVFDSPPAIKKRIESMTKDKRKEFFGSIGVVGATNVVFFQTKLIPKIGPVPQSNGLNEYKFPKETPIEILKAA